MSDPHVLCLGEVLFDCLADQSGRDLSAVESWTPYPGGAPANVACGLVKLGTAAGFIGCVGKDAPGTQLVALLGQSGVTITGIQTTAQAPTRQVYVTRTLAGDRTFAGFGEYDTDAFADTQLQAELLPASLFADASFLVLGTLALAYPQSAAAVHQAIQLAQHAHLQIVIDINWRPVFWADATVARQTILEIVSTADYLKLAMEEAMWLWQTTDAFTIASQLPTLKGVLVTAGAQGCYYCLHGLKGHHPGFAVEVVDTTGAGDAFVAGFIHKLRHTGPPDTLQSAHEMITYANAVGALTTTQAGAIAAQPSAHTVDTFLRAQTPN